MNEGLILIGVAEGRSFLMALYTWGIGVIKAIQRIANPALTVFMKAVTSLGEEYFLILFILFVFWCVNEKKGFRLGLLIIISAWINLCLKVLFDQPRPFELDPSLGLAFEPTRAFPSGHAQNSFTFLIALAFYLTKEKKYSLIVRSLAIFLVLFIGFSRLYLGVHFPTDVLGGWITGALVLGLFYVLEKPFTHFFIKQGKRPQLICAAAAALIMNALHPQDTSISAMLLGFCAGYSIMIKSFPFSAQGELAGEKPGIRSLVLRFVLGFVGAAVIYLGLKLILPGKDSLLAGIPALEGFYEVGRFIRYGLLGFWVSMGAIKLFQQTRLA